MFCRWRFPPSVCPWYENVFEVLSMQSLLRFPRELAIISDWKKESSTRICYLTTMNNVWTDKGFRLYYVDGKTFIPLSDWRTEWVIEWRKSRFIEERRYFPFLTLNKFACLRIRNIFGIFQELNNGFRADIGEVRGTDNVIGEKYCII